MAQNTSYGIGQFSYTETVEYITWLGSTTTTTSSTQPLEKSYVDYKPDIITTYRDVAIKLPENIEYGNSYYMKLSIPQDTNYNTILNLKLCAENSSNDFDINFNKFQQIKRLIVPNTEGISDLYSDVILFDYTTNNPTITVTDADIPINFNGSIYGDQLYYNEADSDHPYKYCLAGTTATSATWTASELVDVNYSKYNLLQGWKLEEQNNNDQIQNSIKNYYFVFSPKYNLTDAYKYLWLEVVHENDQVQFSTQTQHYDGKTIPLNDVQATFYKINNLLPKTEKGIGPIKSGIDTLNNIAITAPENWVCVINGEEVRIGPSGQYKIDDFEITSLGIVGWLPDESEANWKGFVIDYGYKIKN